MIVVNAGSASSGMTVSTDGDSVTLVTACSRSNCMSAAPGRAASCAARHKVAPERHAMTISKIEASKLSDAN